MKEVDNQPEFVPAPEAVNGGETSQGIETADGGEIVQQGAAASQAQTNDPAPTFRKAFDAARLKGPQIVGRRPAPIVGRRVPAKRLPFFSKVDLTDSPKPSPGAPATAQVAGKMKAEPLPCRNDGVKPLPGENIERHHAFQRQAAAAFSADDFFETLRLDDLTFSHAQMSRYILFAQSALAQKTREKFFEITLAVNPKLQKLAKTELWRNGRPTNAGKKALKRAGFTLTGLKGLVFAENLPAFAAMDGMADHFRSVRNEAGRELRPARRGRARQLPPIDAAFRSALEKGADDEPPCPT
jgi:hypothetical protein